MPSYRPKLSGLFLALFFILSACGGGEAPDPARPSANETEALNDAADMLAPLPEPTEGPADSRRDQ